jgi:hypothetical protein
VNVFLTCRECGANLSRGGHLFTCSQGVVSIFSPMQSVGQCECCGVVGAHMGMECPRRVKEHGARLEKLQAEAELARIRLKVAQPSS